MWLQSQSDTRRLSHMLAIAKGDILGLTVHCGVDPFMRRFNLFLKLWWKDINRSFLCGNYVIEGSIEDTNDFGGFVINDAASFLIK